MSRLTAGLTVAEGAPTGAFCIQVLQQTHLGFTELAIVARRCVHGAVEPGWSVLSPSKHKVRKLQTWNIF